MFSALPLKPDIAEYGRHVRFVPLPEVAVSFDHLVGGCQKSVRHLYVECPCSGQVDAEAKSALCGESS
jgi:hypothetical protein